MTNYSGSSVNTPASFHALVEDQFECVSNMEENLLGHSPLDSNKLDHMVTSNADPTLSGVHSHLTRHIQGTNFKIVFISFKKNVHKLECILKNPNQFRLPVNAILCNFCIFFILVVVSLKSNKQSTF